jgi:tetratricopeptide (TPR) repeat protein
LSPEQKSKLVLASGLLLDRWDQIRLKPPATQANSIHIPANLMLAYRLTGDLEAAVKIGKQALEAQPDEPVLIEKLAAALLEIEAVDEAASYIDRLPISADTVMMYYHLYSRQAQWMELRALVRDHLELFPVFERGIARAAETLAELHLSDDEDRHEVLRSGITAAGDDPRALAILAQGARRFGFLDLAEACYKSAREATNPNSASFATRYALAHEAAAHGDWRTIARMFYGHINMEQDSADLRLLARALINQTPIREQARSFFAALPEPIKSEPYYLGTYGVMQIKRGDYVAARQALEDAYSKDQNLALLNPLCETLFHLGQLESLHALVQDSTVDETPGETDQRMRLAHILGDLGHSERAISLGYRALCEAPKSAKISQYYMGLILNPSGELPIAGTEAGLGMYVEITNDIGTKIAGILGDDEDRPWAAAIDPVHPIASAFLGSSVGHSIVRPTDFEMERTWTLSLVQPAWLRAWYDLQENFERRFPDAKGIVRIDVPENDISALIEQIKRQGEREQKRAENYAANQFPLVIAAGKHRAGAVGFADYLLSLEMDVSTATGNPVEFERAQDLIAAHGKRGAVLDSFTAWRAAKFSFLPVLQDMLGPLSIASSELTALKQLIEMQDADRAGETMTTGYRSGQLFRQTMSQGERRDIVAWMETRIADIENHCAVEAVTVPDVLPQDVEQLVEITEPGVFSSLILAGDSRILVSEDLFYRRLGQEAFETKSVWLQAVARHAVAENQLSFESYVDLVRNLAIHRHGIVVFDLAVLTRIYRTDSTSGFYMLSALCRYLGHPSADRRSNVLIACTFLNRIWATCIGREARVPLATGQVLSSILGEHRGDSWDEWAAMMLIGLESGPREQLINWCYATGKPIGQAYEWLNQVRRGTL